ncbi:hypothetical protein FEM48_Zijuj11G0081700 [Ziziphus jujuba var. spinosa]|uniref:Uncharacterized protein n=1 Tax=Ziziphus jujuba var. spinosa TaxID=714518 RepID=A0A978UHT2_ZIZJJ|nr:uncharacterized protein LOC107430476 [Ziziphus jujuba var. spinosa]XP_048319960.1 uncharacterized protein LOC107430476 [Ziziphus jujuba var. spinosa]XP_048319961.1 uncharacterized protein LOC107430476 [Ziziphus jujuba var. spinosa]XP_048319962.1 uncharacterized protein LOC107430476 [Ziziphus jujuba var. spinosa]KAH7514363.1 hypothetical protein FEM48_Zijuj11G0081700 [Ziziphus jujuba var. spinosa]
MKFSLKLPEDQDQNHHHHSPLLKAKIPITMFNQPFLTSISTTTSSPSPDLSFSFSSSFPSGPSLKLSYSPTSTASNPFSISLKSGLGLFGSPNNSPLVFTAQFSPSPINPTFSLHFKPQFGNFSLKKTTFSHPDNNPVSGSYSNDAVTLDSGSYLNVESGDGFAPEGPSSVWQELKLEPCGGRDGFLNSGFVERNGVTSSSGTGLEPERQSAWKNGGKDDGVFSGIAVMARTVLPVTKSVVVNMRWGVNFPANLGTKFPYLALNKIGIERVEEVKEEEKKKKKKNDGTESDVADMEVLKGMCFWMSRDLELLEKENREMKQSLEQIKLGVSGRHYQRESDGGEEKVLQPTRESSGEFERWRSKKSVNEDNERRESKKPTTQASDLESELQKAIKAASA